MLAAAGFSDPVSSVSHLGSISCHWAFILGIAPGEQK